MYMHMYLYIAANRNGIQTISLMGVKHLDAMEKGKLASGSSQVSISDTHFDLCKSELASQPSCWSPDGCQAPRCPNPSGKLASGSRQTASEETAWAASTRTLNPYQKYKTQHISCEISSIASITDTTVRWAVLTPWSCCFWQKRMTVRHPTEV